MIEISDLAELVGGVDRSRQGIQYLPHGLVAAPVLFSGLHQIGDVHRKAPGVDEALALDVGAGRDFDEPDLAAAGPQLCGERSQSLTAFEAAHDL